MPKRGVRWADEDVVYYDDEVLVTRTDAWTAVEIPTVPYSFRARDDRLEMGWASTMALAGLREGDAVLKVVRRPFDPHGWKADADERAYEVGSPGPHWDAYLEAETRAMERVQSTTKHVVLLRRLGSRNVFAQMNTKMARGPVPPVGSGEVSHWHAVAREVRAGLRSSGWRATPLDAYDLRWLRRHALGRGLVIPDPVTGKRVWGRGEVADEFADVTLTPLPRGVRVDTEYGTRFTATLVASAFPVTMSYPDTPPWLAHIDWVGPWAEADVVMSLKTPEKARKDLAFRKSLADDQERDARRGDHVVPMETQQMFDLAHRLEAEVPATRRPVVYGWARFRVDADSEEQLASRVSRLRERFSDAASPHIDLTLPTGMAQVDLLVEGVPGQKVRNRSYMQRWTAEVVGCGMAHAGSNLSHPSGMYVGPTTGRHMQAVTLDPHHGITRRTAADVEGPGGLVLLGAQRAGKSSAIGRMFLDGMEKGFPTVLIDPSGPLSRLASLPQCAGRVEVLDLVKTGGGVLDPMSPAVIPGDAQADPAVREARKQLTRNTLYLLGYRQLRQSSDAYTEMLKAITSEAEGVHPSLLGVIERLKNSPVPAAGALAENLAFDLGDASADLLLGEGAAIGEESDPVSRIVTMPGLSLPKAGVPIEEWMPSQALGAAVFGVAAHLARRLLWDLPPWMLKYLMVDEAHIPMGTAAGRSVIEESLRDGPKHGVVVALATHNAVDLSDERIVNALATKLLFRSTSDVELERALRVAGIEDTPQIRRQIRELKNGECVMVNGDDVRDRVQWDLHDPEVAEALRTTPKGAK